MRGRNKRTADEHSLVMGARRWLWALAMVAMCGSAAALPLAYADGALALLSPVARAHLETPPNEKPYNVRLHFLKSNERRHDLFFSALRGIGGGYLGVGADQNYTLAAVARAEVLWLVDIDGDVVDWHRIYAALIPIAPTSGDLMTLLTGRRDADVQAALRTRWDVAEASRLWPTYLRYRGYLLNHFSVEREYKWRGQPATWLSDPALYQHIFRLMSERRVVARIGDLHGERTVIAIGASAQAAGIKLHTIYLSNVEQWFHYSAQFQRNMASLPHDAATVVLRTLARGELVLPDQDRWHFSVQTLDDFLTQMQAPVMPLTSVHGLMPAMLRATAPGARGVSWIGPVLPTQPVKPPWSALPPLRP